MGKGADSVLDAPLDTTDMIVIKNDPAADLSRWRDAATMSPREAEQMVVNSPATYAEALRRKGMLRDLRIAAEKYHADIKQKIDAAKQPILDQEKAIVRPIKLAEELLEGKALGWKRAEDRRVEEERRKAAEQARKQAEQEALEHAAALEREAAASGNVEQQAEAVALIEKAVAGELEFVAPDVSPSYGRVAGTKVVGRKEIQVTSIRDMLLGIAAGLMVQHASLATVPPEEKALLVGFLQAYGPVADGLRLLEPMKLEEPKKQGQVGRPYRYGMFEIVYGWLSSELAQRGTLDHIPGVVVKNIEGLV